MNIKSIATSRVNPAPYNPRKDLKSDDREYRQLVRSIEEFGFVEPLVWNRRTGNLVGGHQRFKVLLAQGAQQVEVSVVDLPIAKEKALNIALNKISGEWDKDKLAELLDELSQTTEIELDAMGFEVPQAKHLIADILGANESGASFDVDGAPAEDRPTFTEPGDLIKLGRDGQHRILCGDATQSSDLAKLMADSQARLCYTDPPSGVSSDRRRHPAAKKTGAPHDLLRNDDLRPERYANWFGKVAVCLAEALVPGAPFYIWNGHTNFGLMHDLLTANNFKVASVITCAKESIGPGSGDYNERLEHCLCGWKRGARHPWYGPKNASTLWQVRGDRTDLYGRPAPRALELAEHALRNSSRKEDLVLDPFLGRGTTLIAAARLGRQCVGFEIEPRYCDIIVRRYIAVAGRDAVSPDLLDRYCPEEVTL